MTTRRASRTGLATVACATLLLPGCESACRETEMDARDAALVDAGDASSSAVLEARLTSGDRAVRGRTVVFYVVDGNRRELAGSSVTGDDGTARLDLKDRPLELAGNATAESFRAVFDGDGRYCSSRDAAELDLVTLP